MCLSARLSKVKAYQTDSSIQAHHCGIANVGELVPHLIGSPSSKQRRLASFSKAASASALERARNRCRSTCNTGSAAMKVVHRQVARCRYTSCPLCPSRQNHAEALLSPIGLVSYLQRYLIRLFSWSMDICDACVSPRCILLRSRAELIRVRERQQNARESLTSTFHTVCAIIELVDSHGHRHLHLRCCNASLQTAQYCSTAARENRWRHVLCSYYVDYTLLPFSISLIKTEVMRRLTSCYT